MRARSDMGDGQWVNNAKAARRGSEPPNNVVDYATTPTSVPLFQHEFDVFICFLNFLYLFYCFFFSQFLFSPQTLRSFHFFWKILFLVLFGFLISAMCSSALIGCVDPSIQRSVPGARARVVWFVASVLLSILLTWFMMLKGKVVNSFDCSIL